MPKFTIVEGDAIRAPKVSGTGAVYYRHWHNEAEDEYVQIVNNVGGKGVGQGSFNANLYKLDDIGSVNPIEGYDPISSESKPTSDNNMKAFLAAVKLDVIARREANEEHSDNFP